MATTATTANPTNNTDAEFRAWAQFVHDVFANGSWVQTADTGQINLTTVTKPAAVNTKQGYEIWRMDDAHQSTNPIYLKIAYGSGPASALNPAIWFMIGTATDGAGTLIDPDDGNRATHLADFYSQTQAPVFSRGNVATAHDCFGSAETDRAVMLAFEAKPVLQFTGNQCEFVNVTSPDTASVGNYVWLLSIERARDVNGDTTPDHLYVMWTGTTNNGVLTHHLVVPTLHKNLTLNPLFGTVSARPSGSEAIYAHLSTTLLSQLDGVGAAYGIEMFEYGTKPMWPGINVVVSPHSIFDFADPPGSCAVAFNSAYSTGRTAATSPYGTARTYRTCAGPRGSQFQNSNGDAGAFIWILYE